MNDFYVYGLNDPRDNVIFYIGKGKGKRVFQHEKEKASINTNTEKVRIIEEIHNAGLKVQHQIFQENLSEPAALLLERLLIFRIGRSIFEEGKLVNIVPGGLWHKEASFFLNYDTIPSDESISQNFPEILPTLNRFPLISKQFSGIRSPICPNDPPIIVYESTGGKIDEYDVDRLIKIFGLSHAIDLIRNIRLEDEFVYAWNRMWSKQTLQKIPDFSVIPFEDFDIVNLNFLEDFQTSLNNKENITLKYKSNLGTSGVVTIANEGIDISFAYYYVHGSKKHESKTSDGKLNGICYSWYEDGTPKEEILYEKNKRIEKRTFYSNGQLETEEVRNISDTSYQNFVREYYPSGVLKYEYAEDPNYLNSSYSEDGKVKPGFATTKEYSLTGILIKEIKNFYPKGIRGSVHGCETIFDETGKIKSEIDYMTGIENKVIKKIK